MQKIGFIGIGKLGLDCAEVMAEKHEVRGYDIYPRTSDLIKVCDIDECVNESEWIFIAVPTPHAEGYDGSVPSSHMQPRDFGHAAVLDAIDKINKHAQSPKKVVLISTVLPGTTRRNFVPRLDPRHQFLYNPYLIAMGSVKWDMVNPEMVIIGTEDGSITGVAGELIALYKTIMQNDPRYEVGTWDECEAIKIFYNTFISAKVGLVNMIQDFAMRIGNINVDVVTAALARSTMRIMGPKYMTAGMGDAGACHPRDNIALRTLSENLELGYDIFGTITHTREVQAERMAKKCLEYGKSVCIVGKAFKPGVAYTYGSPSMLVGYYIEQLGGTVSYYDPNVSNDALDTDAEVYLIGYIEDWVHKVDFPKTAVVVDPWRTLTDKGLKTVHYGN